ncbi:MAG: type II toxin-antitoxin system RelE/ParE family toxin [Vicinamibacterales bacterium]
MARMGEKMPAKPVRWIASAKEDLSAFPADVKWRVGSAIWQAQIGSKADYAKPLRGFGGTRVLEVVDDYDGDTYRAAYTIQFAEVLYVLHAFQKKSRKGIETPKADVDLIRDRLVRAKQDYQEWRKNLQSR